MSLRQKLFLLLALIALVPLAVLAGLGFRASQSLAVELSAQSRNALVADITQLIARNVQANSRFLDAEADVVELSLRLQAAAVERELRLPPPDLPLYFSARFDGPPEQWPPGTSLTRLGGATQRIAASSTVGSVMIAPGADAVRAHENLERLAGTLDELRALALAHPGLFLAQFTALEGGERDNFPGHGHYPKTYDSRQRTWYAAARTAGKSLWTPPIFSASTNQLTFIAAMPVHGADGRFAGVSSVEIPIVEILRNLDRRTQRQERLGASSLGTVADHVTTILVVPAAGGATFRVLAERAYAEQAPDWSAGPQLATIAGDDPVANHTLVADVLAGRNGIVRMRLNGRDSLWAISPVRAFGAALLVILPYDRVLDAASAGSTAVRAQARSQLRDSIIVATVVLLLLVVVTYYFSGLATDPIRELAFVATRIGGGDLSARADARGNDEIAALATAFNTMVPKLQNGLRMQQGLELARAVQQNLLPLEPPAVPGFDVAGASVYCDETGGDYYDIIDISPDGGRRVEIAAGDVSGHGIGAALLMASVRATLRASIDAGDPPAVSVARANRLLYADVADGSFMTLVLASIDADKGTIRWVNAAHDLPTIYHPETDVFLATAGADVPIGIDPQWTFNEHRLTLPPGEIVFALGTDGIWETEDAGGAQFGRERFREFIRRNSGRPAAEICTAVMDAVAAHRGDMPPADDLTLVIVTFTVGEASMAKETG